MTTRTNATTKTRRHEGQREEEKVFFVCSYLRGTGRVLAVVLLLVPAPAFAATKAIRAGKLIDPAGTVIANAVIVVTIALA